MTEQPDHEVRLRPVLGEDDLAVLDRLDNPADFGELAWQGYRDPGRFRRRWADNGLLGDDGGFLLIVRGDDPVGLVEWSKVPAGGSYFWSFGISLFADSRGKGYGTIAQRLLAEYLFAHTPVERIEATTAVNNIAEQRSLEKAGFTREGVLRRAWFRHGRHRDAVVYGILRDEVPLD